MARTITVDCLTRVEGEGALTIRFDGDSVRDVKLRIFEPPRFFEGLLRGRALEEAPDITARICGICPVAYQMSACHALEDAVGIHVGEPLRTLRRLLYCGEWISSHCLHMFMLHAPDFLGYPDAISMAQEHAELVRRGLRMKQVGNAILSTIGGREIHPVNVKVGGFYRVPAAGELKALLPELIRARDAALETMNEFSRLNFPDFERDYEFVALRHPQEYPFCEGRLVSSKGLDIEVHDFERAFQEEQVPHSTALHSVIKGRGAYVCGPLARVNLNFDKLRPLAREAAVSAGFSVPCHNPFRSILARALEVIQVIDEAIEIIESWAPPAYASVQIPHKAAIGFSCTEAPRGILYHRYEVDGDGLIQDANIVPPTSQNQKSIETDLFDIAARLAAMPHEEAVLLAEQTVRNYDPCISCSTHFLKLGIKRE
ncbi:MAG: Ni/Fe hydrogenase subunit alpha [Gammaproteobacteria bacterium]|nr:MAG: Ni/Fe hydrogenase subunit alpha [Gammaproteobacteria bacterium]